MPTVVGALERSTLRDGRATTGWPVVRWVGKLRPDPLGRLHVGDAEANPGPMIEELVVGCW